MSKKHPSRVRKQVVVLLDDTEHATLKRIAERERRTLGAQLATMALARANADLDLEEKEVLA